jgi:hypothetical protein
MLKDRAISPDTALELMAEHFNPRCNPPWGDGGLEKKVANAYGYGAKRALGERSSAATAKRIADNFQSALSLEELREAEEAAANQNKKAKPMSATSEDEFGETDSAPDLIDEMNRKHAVVFNEGQTVIASFGKERFSLGPVEHLHKWYANDTVAVDTSQGTKWVPKSKVWFGDSSRRQYAGGIVFDPSGRASPDALNLWAGFAVEPNPHASCDLILNHILDVVCDGDIGHFEYVIGWLADLVQNPGRKSGVALVLKGGKGAGKDALAHVVRRMAGERHVAHIDKPDLLTQRFNWHLAQALFVHVEEAFWAGDHSKQGILQGLITSPTITIEPKGVNPFTIGSCLRLIMTTNRDWIVPASHDERRYAVFEVSDRRISDRPYFDALWREIEGDGPAALLAYLQAMDLSRFQVRDVPQTEALRDQKTASLSGLQKWWYEALSTGNLPAVPHGEWETGLVEVDKEQLRTTYGAFIRTRRFQGDAIDPGQFTIQLQKLVPDLVIARPRKGGSRAQVYKLPRLKDCRQCFADWLGQAIEWDTIETPESRRQSFQVVS